MSLATLRRELAELRAIADPPLGACRVLVGGSEAARKGESITPWVERAPDGRVAAFIVGVASRMAAARQQAEADELEDAQDGDA
jgi:hypothetical protein